MSFLIDGYNLLHAMGLMSPRFGPHGLAKARHSLIGLVAGALGDRAASVTVVFDAAEAPPDAPHAFDQRGVHVEFARKGEEADDVLERLIRLNSAPRQLAVVSNDRRIVQAARRRDCQIKSSEDFLDWLQHQYELKKPRPPREPAEKSQGLKAGSTERWLSEFADLADDPAFAELFPFDAFEEKQPPDR
jgi:predicted RNA-binding protein with PIN domain